jgi:hypothetical protein
MNLWDVMVSIFWFMLLVAWFWLLISIISDIFRDDEMSGVGKGLWCIFVILLPWLGVLTYLIVRGPSMKERSVHEAARNEQAFRSYVQQVAVSDSNGAAGVSGELAQLAKLRDQGTLTPDEYEQAKARVLSTPTTAPAGQPQHAAVADNLRA